jgi:hypothetical protein
VRPERPDGEVHDPHARDVYSASLGRYGAGMRTCLGLLTVVAAIAVGPTFVAHAQSAPPSTTFVTLDAVNLRGGGNGVTPMTMPYVRLTGIVLGETTPRTVEFEARTLSSALSEDDFARCDRLFLLAMARPGAFRVTIEHTGGSTRFVTGCSLSRAP